jgi:hypothetical protein
MLCAPFYKIKPDAYLFREKVKNSLSRKQLEEEVRQWCAHELLRAYGLVVSEIEFERSIQMGATQHFIDILVSRGGLPIVVVECKRLGYTNAERAVKQALSYADCNGAEFAVYTNGVEWQVRRRIQGKWCVVPDLPKGIDQRAAEPLAEFLRGVKAVAPLLYALGDPMSGKGALRLLNAMQQFFCGSNLLNDELDRDLLSGTDNFLRVLSCFGDDPYCRSKLAIATKYFEGYRLRMGHGFEFYFNDEPLGHEIQALHANMLNLLEGSGGLSGGEVLLLRLNAALLEYGLALCSKRAYPEITPGLHQTLREYLNYALLFHLNVSLPDHLDNIWIGDVKGYCRWAWEQIEVA